MAYRVLTAGLVAVLCAGCTGQGGSDRGSEKTLVPLPGQETVAQVYVFVPGEAGGSDALLAFPPKPELEEMLNARVEFVPLRGEAPARIETLRNFYSRTSNLTVLLGSDAAKTFFESKLPRDDTRRVVFLGSGGFPSGVSPDPNWFEVALDRAALDRLAQSLCSLPAVKNCEIVPTGPRATAWAVGSSLQIRVGAARALGQDLLRRPYVEIRVAWERVIASFLNPKTSAYNQKSMTIAPGSPFVDVLTDKEMAAPLQGAVTTKLQDVQLESLRGGKASR